MPRFLIDENLPYYFSLWNNDQYIHQKNLGESLTDLQIWEYAKKHDLVIVTKDADFYNLSLINEPPPKVIHIKIGNMRLKVLHDFLNEIWDEVLEMIETVKLINIYEDRLEGIT